MFGQRFLIDSFVLSKVVYDSIIFENLKQQRMMPTGLDVMAVLGNDEAIGPLAKELNRWNYSANLMAGREFVEQFEPAYWKQSLYNRWLDALRLLDDDPTPQQNFPEAMKTKPWQMKQLQTQLASWAELRHDTLLYGKQSYTAYIICEYPAGYVEPYPHFYERIKLLANEAEGLLERADFVVKDPKLDKRLKRVREKQVKFFGTMASHLGRLQGLAEKELNAKPFDEADTAFLKKTIDARGGGSGPPRYDGWYCELFYTTPADWAPTIADVHTDPNDPSSVLEVGVGDTNLCVVAVDNEQDRSVYVGPTYSYYEFHHPAEDRLTDKRWQALIDEANLPPRPDWTRVFQATAIPPPETFEALGGRRPRRR